VSIKISCDSTCDLSKELAQKLNIGIMPLYLINGDETYIDGVNITPEVLYHIVEEEGGSFSTAAVNVSDYADAFREWRGSYDSVIHFTISATMSACYNNACLAAEEVGGVYIIDSKSLSTGIAMLAIEAARLAEEGVSAAEIIDTVSALRQKLDVSFVIEKLDYLRRGGRCSAMQAFGANMLRLKPCIELKDGAMEVGKKYRGGTDKAIAEYLSERLTGRDDIDPRRVIVTYSPSDPGLAEKAIEIVKGFGIFAEVMTANAGCTISNHCGPNTLGVIFFRK